MANERSPLLWNYPSSSSNSQAIVKPSETNANGDLHSQFCMLVGVPSTSTDSPKRAKAPPPKSLYGRASRHLSSQRRTYYATASLSNTLLLSQVVLGAALTGLGASSSSHILITVFGALNTIIAGVVAYLKSRGQPMRSRMYRDDLERVVDEIENSEIMWLGISRGVHGYDEIDTDENRVTVRSEVARLTRLFDRAVRNNSLNNPDMYMAGAGFDGSNTALRSRPQQSSASAPVAGGPVPVVVAPVIDTPSVPPAVGAVPVSTTHDPDESPASAPPKPKKEEEPPKKEEPPRKRRSKTRMPVKENLPLTKARQPMTAKPPLRTITIAPRKRKRKRHRKKDPRKKTQNHRPRLQQMPMRAAAPAAAAKKLPPQPQRPRPLRLTRMPRLQRLPMCPRRKRRALVHPDDN